MTPVPPLSTIDTTQPLGLRRAVDIYLSTVEEICPAVSRQYLDTWTLGPADLIAISELLTSIARPVTVFEVGTFVGGSAFAFGSHPAVTRVVSVDPNPLIADEISDKATMLGSAADAVADLGLRVQDIAAVALGQFPDVAARIELRRGHLGSPSGLASAEATRAVPLPAAPEDTSQLVVFLDGDHTAAAVYADLQAAFSQRPDAVVVLDDCRYVWGPFIQAGVARFLEEHQSERDGYRFRLVTDLVPALSRSTLGVVHRTGNARVEESLQAFARRFSGRMDLLRLLEREDELVHIESAMSEELQAARRLSEERDDLAGQRRQLSEERGELAALLERLRAERDGLTVALERLSAEREDLAGQLSRARQAANAAHERVVALEASTSWRLTAPLRWLRGQQSSRQRR